MVVALYARVSTCKQADKDLSIPDQLRQMREWSQQHAHTVALEYIEADASATDDRRPEFQKMIADACGTPPPFAAIIVHSQSRFFRDSLEFGLYERKLKRAGVRLISITQQTGDDPAGEMARRIFSVFDEYQSKENGKHTLRAMQENARQGYFNGSRPLLGFKTMEVDAEGNKGKKKRVEVEPAEASLIQKVFALYLHGYQGESFGIQKLAVYLNQQELTARGRAWTKSRISDLLRNRIYIGESYFNRFEKRGGKTRAMKPKTEWILKKVEAIVSEDTFNAVQQRLDARSAEKTPPRVVSSPALLTGLLSCGTCGARMVLATGKGGRFRYYKCASRINEGRDSCSSGNLPMEKVDNAVLHSVADRVFIPSRVKMMLEALQARLKRSRTSEEAEIIRLSKELEGVQRRIEKLYEAVGKGYLPMDSTLTERVQKHQVQRQAILIQIAGLRQQKELPYKLLSPKQVGVFSARYCDRSYWTEPVALARPI